MRQLSGVHVGDLMFTRNFPHLHLLLRLYLVYMVGNMYTLVGYRQYLVESWGRMHTQATTSYGLLTTSAWSQYLEARRSDVGVCRKSPDGIMIGPD